MKMINVVAGVAALGLAVGGYALVQTIHGGKAHRMNGADLVGPVSAAFGQFAAFDVNKNGQLEATEKQALGKAIADGSVKLAPPTPPTEAFGNEEARLDHFAEMFARFAAYDANHDGMLDATEQGAIQAAIKQGQLVFPGAENGGAAHAHAHALGKMLHGK